MTNRLRDRWPKGRYNGKRIVGIEFKLKVDVLDWEKWPHLQLNNLYGHLLYFHWGCIRLWIERNFEEGPFGN